MMKFTSVLAGTGLAASMLALALIPAKAEAQPNCPTCLPGYYRCVESGAADCEVRYAVCLQWCVGNAAMQPLPVLPKPAMSPVLQTLALPTLSLSAKG